MIKKLIFIELIIIFFSSISYAQLPNIEERTIIFSSGKKIIYEPFKLIYSELEDATKNFEPESITEKPIIIKEWKRLVLIKTMELYEDHKIEIKIYDYDGNLLNTSPTIIGDVIFLTNTKRIILAQGSAHYIVNESFILDENGNVVKNIDQDSDVFKFGYSEDEKVIWILSNHLTKGTPYTNVKIINYNGELLDTKQVYEKTKIDFNYEKNSYPISIPQPQPPG